MISKHLPHLLLLLMLLLAAGRFATVSASPSSVNRTIIAEPYFQVYEDQFELESSRGNYTVSFILPYPQSLHSVKAYGSDNSELNVYASWDATSGKLTLLVETNGSSSFRLRTIVHYTTVRSNSTYSTLLNLYPGVDEGMEASLVLFPPSDSVLIGTPENLSPASIGGKPALVGTAVLEASASHNATIKYTGSYELVEISSLDHRIRVGQNRLTVTDSLQLVNLDTSPISKVTFSLPEGASLVKVYDSISYMQYTLNGSELTVNLRTRLLPTEKTSLTLVYDLPSSGRIGSQGVKAVLRGDYLPDWCKYLVRSLSLVVELPSGSSEVSAPGFEITNGSSSIECRARASDIYPHSGMSYAISFVPAPASISAGAIVLAAVVLLAVLALIAYYIRHKGSFNKPTPPTPPAHPSPAPKRSKSRQ